MNRVSESARRRMEFFQASEGINIFINYKVHLLNTNTKKIITHTNIQLNVTNGIMIEPTPRLTFSYKSIVYHTDILKIIPLFTKS